MQSISILFHDRKRKEKKTNKQTTTTKRNKKVVLVVYHSRSIQGRDRNPGHHSDMPSKDEIERRRRKCTIPTYRLMEKRPKTSCQPKFRDSSDPHPTNLALCALDTNLVGDIFAAIVAMVLGIK